MYYCVKVYFALVLTGNSRGFGKKLLNRDMWYIEARDIKVTLYSVYVFYVLYITKL